MSFIAQLNELVSPAGALILAIVAAHVWTLVKVKQHDDADKELKESVRSLHAKIDSNFRDLNSRLDNFKINKD